MAEDHTQDQDKRPLPNPDIQFLIMMAEKGLEASRLERLKYGHEVGTKRLGLYDNEYDAMETARQKIEAAFLKR